MILNMPDLLGVFYSFSIIKLTGIPRFSLKCT